jgi:hypothetical protein
MSCKCKLLKGKSPPHTFGKWIFSVQLLVNSYSGLFVQKELLDFFPIPCMYYLLPLPPQISYLNIVNLSYYSSILMY